MEIIILVKKQTKKQVSQGISSTYLVIRKYYQKAKKIKKRNKTYQTVTSLSLPPQLVSIFKLLLSKLLTLYVINVIIL